MKNLFACLVGLVLLLAANKSSADECGSDALSAIRTAQASLKANVPQQRRALECLVQAVAAIEQKIQGLSDGTIAFEGQIYAPKGFAVTKSPTREGK